MDLHSNGKGKIGFITETSNPNYKFKFAQAVTDVICRALRVRQDDRRIVEALLLGVIESHVTQRNGLLDQYLHTQLDILADTFKQKFDLNKDIGVNYNHATHAKFNDIIEAIQKKYKPC